MHAATLSCRLIAEHFICLFMLTFISIFNLKFIIILQAPFIMMLNRNRPNNKREFLALPNILKSTDMNYNLYPLWNQAFEEFEMH